MMNARKPPRPLLSLHLAVMLFGLSGVIGRIVHVSPLHSPADVFSAPRPFFSSSFGSGGSP